MVNVGDIHFDGLTRANASLLLKAAKKVGVPADSIRTTSTGFIVPAEVAAALGPDEGVEKAAQAKPGRKPRRSTKKTDAPASVTTDTADNGGE